MPRIGVTYDQVAAIADAMVAEGITPTIKNIRERLGDTGSHNTIHKHLVDWREARPQRVVASSDAHSSAVLTFNQFLDQARSEGRAEVESRLVVIQAEAIELAAQGEVMEAELSRCTEELCSLTAERDALHIKIAGLNDEIAHVYGENERERFAAELARTEVAQLRNKLDMQIERLEELGDSVESLRREVMVESQSRIDAEKKAAVLAEIFQVEQEKSRSLVLEKESQSAQLITALQTAEVDRIGAAKIAVELELQSVTLKEKVDEIGGLKELLEFERAARCRAEIRLEVLVKNASQPIGQADLGP